MRNQQYEQEFERAFDGRFRLRWSNKAQEYMVEQKIRRGLEIPPLVNPNTNVLDTYDDHYIRARDGYFLTFTIKPGDRMPCPVCRIELPVPVFKTAEVTCEYCKVMGRDARYKAAHFPLNQSLIDYVRELDPHTDGPERSRKRIRESQLKFEREKQSKQMDQADEMIRDAGNQVMNNPMVGYGSQKTVQNDDGSRVDVDRLFR